MAKKSKRNWLRGILERVNEEVNTLAYKSNTYYISDKDDFKLLWREIKDDEDIIETIGELVINLQRKSCPNESVIQRRATMKKNIEKTEEQNLEFRRFLLAE